MSLLKTEKLSKIFRTEEIETIALNQVSLEVNEGEFVAIMGPSGCGKSTLLNILGLLDNPTGGQYYLLGKEVGSLKEKERTQYRKGKIGFVFQSFNLIEELNVFENVAFGMRVQKRSSAEIRENVAKMLKMVNLTGFEKRSVHTLSGGQQQRVAIARALANHPKVLLLDEPLAALDLKLRKDMQTELKSIQKALGITFIYVTHDQEEALSMSDTVVVMDNGKIQQIGTPQDIYNEPQNAFVADFIGESNILDGVMHADYLVEFFGRKFSCLDAGFEKDEPVDVVIRPEDIDIVEPIKGDLVGTVTAVTFKGVHYETIVDFKGFKWMIQTTDFYDVGRSIGIRLNPEDIHIMKKSAYSGMFGDYSSYSEEFDELADPEADLSEEQEGADEV